MLLCCLKASKTAIEESHAAVKKCFRENCLSAVSTVCQVCDEYETSASIQDLHHLNCCCEVTPLQLPAGRMSSCPRTKSCELAFCVCSEGRRET